MVLCNDSSIIDFTQKNNSPSVIAVTWFVGVFGNITVKRKAPEWGFLLLTLISW
jgi:hypothetical protein